MKTQELFLKTAFCCMACDGDIANEEVELLSNMIKDTDLFNDVDVSGLTKNYITQINQQGPCFLSNYLEELKNSSLNKGEQLNIVKIAIKTIEADNKIQYQEISFFKKIRKLLPISNEDIKGLFQDNGQIELYLLPDIDDDLDILQNISFDNLNITLQI